MSNEPFIICRIGKVSQAAQIEAMAGHHQRTRLTRNADPDRQHLNRFVVGTGDVRSDIEEALLRINAKHSRTRDGKLRKNAVRAIEMLMTASPEYFRPDDVHTAGTWQQDRVDAFVDRVVAEARHRYGWRLVSAVLHLDEATPHLHLVIIPADEKPDGTIGLNARDLFGSKRKLKQLQDWAGEVGAPIGLRRGRPDSDAQHEEIREFYARMGEAVDATELELEEAATERAMAEVFRERQAAAEVQHRKRMQQEKEWAEATERSLRQREEDLRQREQAIHAREKVAVATQRLLENRTSEVVALRHELEREIGTVRSLAVRFRQALERM